MEGGRGGEGFPAYCSGDFPYHPKATLRRLIYVFQRFRTSKGVSFCPIVFRPLDCVLIALWGPRGPLKESPKRNKKNPVPRPYAGRALGVRRPCPERRTPTNLSFSDSCIVFVLFFLSES